MRENLRQLRPWLLLTGLLLLAVVLAPAPDAEAFVVCGNNVCEPNGHPFGEDCEICPQDCGGQCYICGNGFCTSPESCSTCSADCGTCPGDTDTDGDGVYDDVDNCVNDWNPNQADCDGDGSGDVCDDVDGNYVQVDYGLCHISGYQSGSYSSWVTGYYEARYTDTSACNSPDIWTSAGTTSHYCSDKSNPYDCCTRWFGFYDCSVNYGFYNCHF